MNVDRVQAAANGATVLALLLCGAPLACYMLGETDGRPKPDDSSVPVKDGTAAAQRSYQRLPMRECRWCGRTVNLNRHHAVPQAANPALRDVRENLIVLCRDCHFVLGHRCDWKRYNPDVMYIATHFTNCVKSADTRAEIEKPDGGTSAPVAQPPDAIGCTDILHVTNDVPAAQRDALERILKSGTESNHPD